MRPTTPPFSAPWYRGSAGFAQALSDSRRLIGPDAGLRSALGAQATRAAAWRATVSAEIREQQMTGRRPTAGQALADMTAFDRFRSANATYLSALSARRATASRRAGWLAAALVAGVALALGLIALLVARLLETRARVRAQRRRELRELLQASASEAESQQLLIRHVERIVPGSAAAVLHRDETEDRLEAVLDGPALTGPACSTSALSTCAGAPAWPSASAAPTSAHPGANRCWNARSAARWEASWPASRCWSAAAPSAPCSWPTSGRSTTSSATRCASQSSQAAPILANQRTLELAEWRAAADPLTGLPNRRAAEETMRRMAAHAGRTLTPLAALLVDLDRFAADQRPPRP